MSRYCKYCGEFMRTDNETSPYDSSKYRSFSSCAKCGAVCEGKYKDVRNGVEVIEEKWWNPKTKQYEK